MRFRCRRSTSSIVGMRFSQKTGITCGAGRAGVFEGAETVASGMLPRAPGVVNGRGPDDASIGCTRIARLVSRGSWISGRQKTLPSGRGYADGRKEGVRKKIAGEFCNPRCRHSPPTPERGSWFIDPPRCSFFKFITVESDHELWLKFTLNHLERSRSSTEVRQRTNPESAGEAVRRLESHILRLAAGIKRQ
jgi:hypothetical protein